MRILIVGSGGREHALAWALAQARDVELICAPGNGGTATIAENVAIAADDAQAIADLCTSRDINLVIVGPDAALAAGVVDACSRVGVNAFGPTKSAARIETSKYFAKQIMRDAAAETAEWVTGTVDDRYDALDFIKERNGNVVVKADGLAQGKGVMLCSSVAEAEAALAACLDEDRFGVAGQRVVVEETLVGREVSVFAICDGISAKILPPACDYKRAFEGDTGPNTGGMGAYTPPLDMDLNEVMARAEDDIIGPCLEVMRRRNATFRGCLYVGVMVTTDGVKVLEFNARFGDPEAQAIMPILNDDLVTLFEDAALGRQSPGNVLTTGQASVTVVATTAEYPSESRLGMPLQITEPQDPDSFIFHAGTTLDGGALSVSGGRVLSATGRGDTVDAARRRAYDAVAGISFDGMRFRSDIGLAMTVVRQV